MDSFFKDCLYEVIPYNNVDIELIFDHYFNEYAPFSTKEKKKSEFPDAFVIQSIKDFVSKTRNKIIIVSNDPDWENSFLDNEHIVFMNKIHEALNYINEINRNNSAQYYFELVEEELYKLLINEIENASFYDVNSPETKDVEIDDVGVKEITDICLLSVDDYEVIISGVAEAEISIHANVFDEGNSFWDNEENAYIIKEYTPTAIFLSESVYFEATIPINENGTYDDSCSIEINALNDENDFEFDVIEDAI